MPGSIWIADRPLDGRSWRCGSSWRTWRDDDAAEGVAGGAAGGVARGAAAGARRIVPDLEDALVVAELTAEAQTGAPDPLGAVPTLHPSSPPASSPLIEIGGIGQRFGGSRLSKAWTSTSSPAKSSA
jgi:hypothetical protein